MYNECKVSALRVKNRDETTFHVRRTSQAANIDLKSVETSKTKLGLNA